MMLEKTISAAEDRAQPHSELGKTNLEAEAQTTKEAQPMANKEALLKTISAAEERATQLEYQLESLPACSTDLGVGLKLLFGDAGFGGPGNKPLRLRLRAPLQVGDSLLRDLKEHSTHASQKKYANKIDDPIVLFSSGPVHDEEGHPNTLTDQLSPAPLDALSNELHDRTAPTESKVAKTRSQCNQAKKTYAGTPKAPPWQSGSGFGHPGLPLLGIGGRRRTRGTVATLTSILELPL